MFTNSPITLSTDFLGQTITLQTGLLAQQATASVLATIGQTTVLAVVVVGHDKDGDYFPLQVIYEERYYASGKFRDSQFSKREGRASENAVLTGRMVDRSLRSLFDPNIRTEIQVVITVLSIDEINPPDTLSVLAASSALMLCGLEVQNSPSSKLITQDGVSVFGIDKLPSTAIIPSIQKDLAVIRITETGELVTLEENGVYEFPKYLISPDHAAVQTVQANFGINNLQFVRQLPACYSLISIPNENGQSQFEQNNYSLFQISQDDWNSRASNQLKTLSKSKIQAQTSDQNSWIIDHLEVALPFQGPVASVRIGMQYPDYGAQILQELSELGRQHPMSWETAETILHKASEVLNVDDQLDKESLTKISHLLGKSDPTLAVKFKDYYRSNTRLPRSEITNRYPAANRFYINPSYTVQKEAIVDLVVSGTDTEVVMLECGADTVSETNISLCLDQAASVLPKLNQFQREFVVLASK